MTVTAPGCDLGQSAGESAPLLVFDANAPLLFFPYVYNEQTVLERAPSIMAG